MPSQDIRQVNSYSNAGKVDRSLAKYFDIPQVVTRNGQNVNIAEHNAAILKKRKGNAFNK